MLMPQGHLLTPKEAGEILALSTSWLSKLRLTGDGPQFIKIGRRVRYRVADLIQWAEAGLRRSTSQFSAQAATQPGTSAITGRRVR